MGVKASQERLSAAVFMKAGISKPVLIKFNTVLPACLSIEMRLQGGFEELCIHVIQLKLITAEREHQPAAGVVPQLSSASGQSAGVCYQGSPGPTVTC